MTNRTRSRGLTRLLLIIGAFMVFVQVQRSAGAVIANELLRQGYSPADIASVVSAMFLAAAIGQIPTGLAFDRFGATRTLAGMSLIAVVGIVLFALADSAAGLATGRFLIGLGHGGTIAGIYLLALTWVTPSRVATMTGSIVAVAGGIGGLLATAPLLLALERVGHRGTFLGLAFAVTVVTVAIALWVRDAPEGTTAPAAARRGETLATSVAGLVAVMRNRQLWPLFAMGGCFSVTFHAIGGLWAGPYFHDIQGFSRQNAAYAVLVLVAAYHLGNALYGPAEQYFRSCKGTIAGGVSIMIVIMGLLTLWPQPPAPIAIALLTLFCLCTPIYPVLVAHCRAFVPLSHAGRAVACINLAGLLVVFIGQASTGLIMEIAAGEHGVTTALGYRGVFATIGVLLTAGLIGYWRADDAPS